MNGFYEVEAEYIDFMTKKYLFAINFVIINMWELLVTVVVIKLYARIDIFM